MNTRFIFIFFALFMSIQAMDRPPLEGTDEWKIVRSDIQRTLKEVKERTKKLALEKAAILKSQESFINTSRPHKWTKKEALKAREAIIKKYAVPTKEEQ